LHFSLWSSISDACHPDVPSMRTSFGNVQALLSAIALIDPAPTWSLRGTVIAEEAQLFE